MDFKKSKLTGMWKKTPRGGGNAFLVGNFTREGLLKLLGDVDGPSGTDKYSLMVFINTKREGKDTDPDYTAHIVEDTYERASAPKGAGYTVDPEDPF